MHKLVKILKDQDGIKVDKPVWHLVIRHDGSESALCTGEVFGEGESSVEFEVKVVHKGIPCKKCHAIIKWFKSIKL